MNGILFQTDEMPNTCSRTIQQMHVISNNLNETNIPKRDRISWNKPLNPTEALVRVECSAIPLGGSFDTKNISAQHITPRPGVTCKQMLKVQLTDIQSECIFSTTLKFYY